MNTQEIAKMKQKFQELEKKTDAELWEMKTDLEKAVYILDKKLPEWEFAWREEYISIAKELSQKWFLKDKISQILASRGKGKHKRVKEEAMEHFEYT